MKQKKLFSSRLMGYSKKDVNGYLLENSEKMQAKLNAQYDKAEVLIKENNDLKIKVSALEEKIRSYEQNLKDYEEKKTLINNAILSAEKRADEVISEALSEAEQRKTDIETDIARSAVILKKLNAEIKFLKENVIDSVANYQRQLDTLISATDKSVADAKNLTESEE